MAKKQFKKEFYRLIGLSNQSEIKGNYVLLNDKTKHLEQSQTNKVFSEKWIKYNDNPVKEKLYRMQRKWYLKLYGFSSERNLASFLKNKKVIFDAGCGLGYKAAWFANLAPNSLVIGMDLSDAVKIAAKNYENLSNLFFLKGDIAKTPFPNSSVGYVSCDQVIHHTQNPNKTFKELTRITKNKSGELACYFYAKKALPRELLDDYFRTKCIEMNSDELWNMSKQLTELGKRLTDLKVSFEAPEIPALGIKGGKYDIQRFIYWNFIKCFWNKELGQETSVATNYDWYSPSNAQRYSNKDIKDLVKRNGLSIVHFHKEEACYSGRFIR